MSTKIITIGLDGPNRVGKGTQAKLIQQWFQSQQIPALIIRGAGTRPGLGQEKGDPESAWWQSVNQWIRTPKATYHDWDMTSARLARELLIWRDRILPRCAQKNERQTAVLIIDRTLLSRTITLRLRAETNIADKLYPPEAFGKRQPITSVEVCPDILFQLLAPKELLLSRLEPNDPKYAFRKRLIETTTDYFYDAEQFIPTQLQKRIKKLDASLSIGQLFSHILDHLKSSSPFETYPIS